MVSLKERFTLFLINVSPEHTQNHKWYNILQIEQEHWRSHGGAEGRVHYSVVGLAQNCQEIFSGVGMVIGTKSMCEDLTPRRIFCCMSFFTQICRCASYSGTRYAIDWTGSIGATEEQGGLRQKRCVISVSPKSSDYSCFTFHKSVPTAKSIRQLLTRLLSRPFKCRRRMNGTNS